MDPKEHVHILLRVERLERELGKLLTAAAIVGADCLDIEGAENYAAELQAINQGIVAPYERAYYLRERMIKEW
jgi:hypothetical protein